MTEKERRADVRRRVAEKMTERIEKRKAAKPTEPAPRYDEVFYEGTAWLNRK